VSSPAALLAAPARTGRDSVLLSASFLVTSLSGAGVALLLTFVGGSGTGTDAVLAAYSLYTLLALFAATARAALVPLYGATEPAEAFAARAAETAGRAALAGLAGALLLAALAPLLAALTTGQLPEEAQRTATWALLLLAPSAYLQVRAAALAAVLSAARRFAFSALAYAGAGLVSLVLAGPAIALLGVLGGPVAILAGSIALAAAHERHLRGFAVRPRARLRWLREGRQWRLTASLVAISAIGLASQAQLAVSLGNLGSEPAEITVYAYAYFLVLTLLSVTSASASLATLPGLVADEARGDRRAVEDYLVRTAPFGIAVVVPLLAAAAAFGRPVLALVFDGVLAPEKVVLLHELIAVLALLGLAYGVLYVVGPVVLVVGRQAALAAVGLLAVLVQLAAVRAVRGDALAVAGVHAAVAAGMTLAVCALALGRRTPEVLAALAVRCAPAAVLALPFLSGLALGTDAPAGQAVAAALGCLALYAALGTRLWPGVIGAFPVLRRLRGSPRRRRP